MPSPYLVGQYDTILVLLSYFAAALASYAAIDLVHRISLNRSRQVLWLSLGALAMGSGIWTMHFVGMQAFSLPIELGYEPFRTVVSYFAGLTVAGLGLFAASREYMGARAVLIGALLMGAGICAMHYIGMYAMNMQPQIVWQPWLVAASAVIAVSASGAALWIMHNLRNISQKYRLPARLGAAMIMAVAVAGMHYTGMAAANFEAGAICGAAGSLNSRWMAWVLAAFVSLFTVMVMITAALDVHVQAAKAERARLHALEARARMLSSFDSYTMMHNRSAFNQEILAMIQRSERAGASFELFYGKLQLATDCNASDLHTAMQIIAERLRPLIRRDDFLARYTDDEFVLIRPRQNADASAGGLRKQMLAACALSIHTGTRTLAPRAQIGWGVYPVDGAYSRPLLQAAAAMAARENEPLPDHPATAQSAAD